MVLGDRISYFPPEHQAALEAFCEQYHPSMDVEKNFSASGPLFFDDKRTSVAVIAAENRSGMLYCKAPYTTVSVLHTGGMIRGWIQSDKMIDADDMFLVPLSSLEAMPSKFDFAVSCPHLSVYGGFQTVGENFWTCFNCGKPLVPSDTSKTYSM